MKYLKTTLWDASKDKQFSNNMEQWEWASRKFWLKWKKRCFYVIIWTKSIMPRICAITATIEKANLKWLLHANIATSLIIQMVYAKTATLLNTTWRENRKIKPSKKMLKVAQKIRLNLKNQIILNLLVSFSLTWRNHKTTAFNRTLQSYQRFKNWNNAKVKMMARIKYLLGQKEQGVKEIMIYARRNKCMISWVIQNSWLKSKIIIFEYIL